MLLIPLMLAHARNFIVFRVLFPISLADAGAIC